MKVLFINTVFGRGSTGRLTKELVEALTPQGFECYAAYGQGDTDYPGTFRIGTKMENHFHNAFYTRLLGLHGYGTRRGTRRLLMWIDQIEPDIIDLRNLHANYLNYPMLFRYIVEKETPVVFSLFDCFNFTGKCSHFTAQGCYKWQTECHHCPLIHTTAPSLFFDNSRKIFREKKAFYTQIKNMAVVAGSKWQRGEVEKSILAGNGHIVTHIYHWIDHDKFHRATQEEMDAFKRKYGLRADRKYLISVSQGWDKRASRYQDAVRLARVLPEDYRLILVGHRAKGTSIEPPLIHIPYINGTKELSAAYSMAEAYVHLSVEDTFGLVTAEAMCCGTVPVAFNSTACAEVGGPYGVGVEPHDVEGIVKALPRLEELKKDAPKIVRYVRDNYDYQTNTARYAALYRRLLAGKR